MRLRFLSALLFTATALAQAPPLPSTTAQIRTGTELVVVDVVVQDRSGKAVHNLSREDFRITEGKAPQSIAAFDEHSTANPPKAGPPLPPLPPGTFSNYTPVLPTGALNVLLIDAMNTPQTDQAYLRNQLKEYVNQSHPGTQIAIFGLNTRLYLLQGFTADPEILKEAVNRKLIPRGSHLIDDPLTGAADTSLSDTADGLASAAPAGGAEAAALANIAANLRQFEAVQQADQTQLRIQYTLDAFNALAHYLSAFPGRKNLLWFSGSFPLSVLPDASIKDPFAVLRSRDDEFRETTGLLSRAEVAVYPIDARGLVPPPMLNASNSGSAYNGNPSRFNNDLVKFNTAQAAEHGTMDQMASDTGGRAFYNGNGLTTAVASALETGSNFYTLAYTPTDRNPHGEYRSIHVEVTGPSAGGVKLYYRRGYYADLRKSDKTPPVASTSPALTGAEAKAAAYTHVVMSHGAPNPEDILFKVRVLPVSPATDATLLPTEQPDPAHPFKGPYRRYNIDYAALGSALRLTRQPDGTRAGAVEFKVFVYDDDGKLLNVAGQSVQLNLMPENYTRLLKYGLSMHLEVSAPARGEAYLRIALHDIPTNRYGVVEIPTSTVSKLPSPPPQPAAPASAPNPPATPPPPGSSPAGVH